MSFCTNNIILIIESAFQDVYYTSMFCQIGRTPKYKSSIRSSNIPIKQHINQATYQSSNISINQASKQSSNQSINQSNSQSVSVSTNVSYKVIIIQFTTYQQIHISINPLIYISTNKQKHKQRTTLLSINNSIKKDVIHLIELFYFKH